MEVGMSPCDSRKGEHVCAERETTPVTLFY